MNANKNTALKGEKILQICLDSAAIELGLMISSFGTALFYSADIGSSAMATFCDGLHLLLNTSYGNANMYANIAFLIILAFIKPKYIGVGTLLCVFTIGPWLNLFMEILRPMDIAQMSMIIRILASVAGAAMMGLGLGLYMSRNSGYGALEGIVKVICEKTSIPLKNAKILQDAVLVIGGILLHATWGVGTIIGIVLTGPFMQMSNKLFSKQYSLWLK